MLKRVILTALAVLGLGSVPVHAQSPEAVAMLAMMGDGPVLVVPVLLRFSDLTTEQESRVQQIIAADRTHVEDLLRQLGEANNQLAQTLLTPKSTHVKSASPLVQRLAQLRLQLMQRELNTVLAIRKVLTQEQLLKVAEAMDAMQKSATASSLSTY